MRVAFILLLLATLLRAENFRLYLKDGEYHMVREYQVLTDRVRYYSIERADWEELPLDLVDLKKTEAERSARVEADKKRQAMDEAEDKFDKAVAREIRSIPEHPGVYYVRDGRVQEIKLGEIKMVTDKKRSILKAMSPIPIVAGKAKLELQGTQAAVALPPEELSLYFRLDSQQRFGIARTKPLKEGRQVAIWTIEPVSKMVFFDMELVDVYRQQVKENLYKIWPTKPIPPGEYAVVQYVEGDGEIQVWDFRVAPAEPK
jgi:hypothetical protein